MSEKPSYLGLLNAISLAETRACEYLSEWIDVTPSPEVRRVLVTVAAREGEHGLAFKKRIVELGYELRPKVDPSQVKRMAIATSKRTDLEKFEKFGLAGLEGRELKFLEGIFKDHSIDVRTGELLGRYIAEEYDTARLLRSCYELLKEHAARTSNGSAKTNGRAKANGRAKTNGRTKPRTKASSSR